MIPSDAVGLFAGAVALGVVHGVEPGHGWPVAASYALDQSNKWLYGFAASLILGVGHLVSSIAMVLAFFFAKSYFELTEINEPLSVAGVEIGGLLGVAAGVLLILLGVREYRHGHGHSHAEEDDHAREHTHTRGHHDDGAGDHSHGHGAGTAGSSTGCGSHSPSLGDTDTPRRRTRPTGGCGGSRGSLSFSGSPTRRSSRSSPSVRGPSTASR